jgi:2-polyprenyl-3-methyl-5-hydroxy-6-metoxy-1,4-benzoquinol methylase
MDPRRRCIAGLAVRWRTLRATRSGEDHADDGERAFGLWVVDRDLDALVAEVTQVQFERYDERLPYFGAIWPAAESLAVHLLTGPRLDGRRVLDLGCGLGASGFAARRRGARVTFLDWEPRAIELVAATARVHGEQDRECACIVGDWRDPPACGPFDVILGADVLYEERNAPVVAAFLAGHLEPGGEAWIADPGRPHAPLFLTLAQAAGLEFLSRETLAPLEAATCREIELLRLRRPQ